MQARYANDPERGQGYGRFVITGASLSSDGGYTFSVQRAGDGRNLGVAGWQDAEERLKPDAVSVEGPTLILSVSPSVVNHLDELETYRLTLQPDGSAPQRSVLELSTIVYAGMASGNGLAQTAPSSPPPPPTADPQPELSPAPELLVIPENAPPVKKNLLSAALFGLVLVAVTLAAGWWFLIRDKPAASPAQDNPVQQEGAQPGSEKPKAEAPEPEPPAKAPEPASVPMPEKAPEAAVQSQAQTAPPVSPKEQVHTFMRKGGTPAEAMALSRSLPKDTVEGQDANFLVLEMAAEGGDPLAMIGVARYYDPSDAAPSGTIAKDMEQAWLWYAKALKAGAADARAGLERLTAWLEKQAADVSAGTAAQARDLLKRIKQAE